MPRSVSMNPMESASASRQHPRELEHLLELLATGSLAGIDDLDAAQQALLRAAFPEVEDLQEILDHVGELGPQER